MLMEAGVTSGSAALAAEVRKHNADDAKCSELGWSCIPIAVEAYGCWGAEAMQNLSRLASRLATRGNCSKSHATCLLYGRLSLTLTRANTRALLTRAGSSVEDLYCNISPFVCNVYDHLYGSVSEKMKFKVAIYIKSYKNASHLNR